MIGTLRYPVEFDAAPVASWPDGLVYCLECGESTLGDEPLTHAETCAWVTHDDTNARADLSVSPAPAGRHPPRRSAPSSDPLLDHLRRDFDGSL